MVVVTVFLLVVTGAIVLAMRMDEDPSRWSSPAGAVTSDDATGVVDPLEEPSGS